MKDSVERLRRILAVALETDSEGEALNALRLLRKWRLQKKQSGEAFIDALHVQLPPVLGMPINNSATWEEQLDLLHRNQGYLSDRELEFVLSLVSQRKNRIRWRPSIKQGKWLRSIHSRVSIVAT